MDMQKFAEGDYVTIDLVKESQTKKAVILNIVEEEQRAKITVEIDGKKKISNPNRDSIKNMLNAWGKDHMDWLNKSVNLIIITANGKERLNWQPETSGEISEEKVFDKPEGEL